MKTPYDTALRARQREVDALRARIGAATEQATQAQARKQAAYDADAREKEMAAIFSLSFPAHAYFRRAGTERDALTQMCADADAALDTLRAEARTSYGSLHVLQTAADTFREEAGRAAAVADQARIDDFSAARWVGAKAR